MPDQYFVEEPETFYGGGKPLLSPCGVQRGSIDTLQVIPERIVNRPYCIDRFSHDNYSCDFRIKIFLLQATIQSSQGGEVLGSEKGAGCGPGIFLSPWQKWVGKILA
jgi:hypothetical protein